MVVNYKTVPLTRNNKLVFLSPNEKNGFHAYQNYLGVFSRATWDRVLDGRPAVRSEIPGC